MNDIVELNKGLKDCVVCRNKAEIIVSTGSITKKTKYLIKCINCDVHVGPSSDLENLIKFWNM